MQIAQAHNEEDKRLELSLMLQCGRGMTLAVLMRLYIAGSALVKGGKYDEEEAEKTRPILGAGVEKWAHAAREIDAAFHALEIIVPYSGGGKKSDVDPFSPEWLADVVSVAARAANDTAENIMRRYPLALVLHFVAAEHRRNGGVTRRPLDTDSVLTALQEAKHGGQGN